VYTVAILENKPNIRKLVMMTLGDKKFKYLEASDADEGIEKVLKELPDFIICSQDISGKPGIEVCKTIKKVHGLAQIPFLLLYGQRRPDDERMREAGVNGAVPKKLLTRFLRDEVKRVLSQPASYPAAEHVADAAEAEPDVDAADELTGAAAGSASKHSLSRPSLYKQKAAEQAKQLLSDGYMPVEEEDMADAFGDYDVASHGGASDEPQSRYDDIGLRGAYEDPVREFLKDSMAGVRRAPAARPRAAHPPAGGPEHAEPPGRRAAPAGAPGRTGEVSMSEEELHEIVRTACVNALREIIPELKRRLVACLERELKGRK